MRPLRRYQNEIGAARSITRHYRSSAFEINNHERAGAGSLLYLVDDGVLGDITHDRDPFRQLDYLHIYSGTSAIPTATVRLRVRGEVREGAAIGDGPVDAV